jgi:quinol monooxygenase YgiN
VQYRVAPSDRDAFLDAMAEVRRVRGRAGALFWQLYEDVAHADGWLEVWGMESWTDHLREAGRMSEEDRTALVRAASFQQGGERPALSRYLAVTPHEHRRLGRNIP